MEKINAHDRSIQKFDAVINWELFRDPIEQALQVASNHTKPSNLNLQSIIICYH